MPLGLAFPVKNSSNHKGSLQTVQSPLRPPALVASETVLSTPYFRIARETFRRADQNEPFDHYTLEHPDGLIILSLTPAEEIILIRQYRPALKQFTLELPCGAIDPGETPLEAARRELYEETGYHCELQQVGIGRIMMNRVASRELCFFGRNAVPDPNFVCREQIEVKLFKPEVFRELVIAGEFEQLATLGTILLAEWKLGFRLFS